MTRFALATTLASLVACLPAVETERGADASTSSASVVLLDGLGIAQDATACSRRPRIHVIGALGPTNESDGPLVIRGEPDDALLEDIRRRPLTAATLGRALPATASFEGATYSIELSRPLEPGASISVVLPAFLVAEGETARPLVQTFSVAPTSAGAVLVESFPPDGSIGLGSTLSAIDLGFDDDIDGVPGIEVRDADGSLVPAFASPIECADIGLVSIRCVRVALGAELRADATYTLHCATLRDRHGDAPCSAPIVLATTSSPTPATPVPIACAIDERTLSFGCLLERDDRVTVRVRLANLARISLSIEGRSVVSITRGGDASVTLASLETDASYAARLRIEGATGSPTATDFEMRTTAAMPDVVLGEVRSDALGAEPAQEYVELWNLGDSAVDLSGFRLADAPDREGDLLPAPLVVPRLGVALVVADAFDATNGPDVAPPPGAMLVWIGASIASSGLANAGEPLFLRDPLGRRVSEMPALAARGPGLCIERDDSTYVHGEAGHYAARSDGCTPGTR